MQESNINMPLVSVVVPLYNRATLIISTLNSLKNQTHRPIEVIVIDDGSTDNGADLVEQWKSSNQSENFFVYLYRRQNAGAPAARNYGINASSGKYIQFLDSDDTIEPVKIEMQVMALEESNADFSYCDFQSVSISGGVIKVVYNNGNIYKKVKKGWSLYTSTPLILSDMIKSGIYWNERLRRNQDIDFLARALFISKSIVYTPGVWCNYIQHSGAQISDSYKRTRPQYFERVKSLLILLSVPPRKLSIAMQLAIVQTTVNLLGQALEYYCKQCLRLVIGNERFERLKSSRLKSKIK